MARPLFSPGQNRLLNRLPKAIGERLHKLMHRVSLKSSDGIYEFHGPIKYSYFPIDCVLSAVTVMQDGSAIEVATIGNEGAIGLPAYSAADTSPHRVFAQVAGEALRIDSSVLRNEMKRDDSLSELLGRYAAAFLAQVSVSVACNGLHSLEKRCCRWLLMTHDRLSSDELPLTHEFLSMMLGVRRAGVGEAIHALEEQGIIRNSRSVIIVADRDALEAKSCECYQVATDEYRRILG